MSNHSLAEHHRRFMKHLKQACIIRVCEAAAVLNVSAPTVRRMVASGLLPCLRYPGGRLRFWLSDVLDLAERRTEPLTK